MTKTLSVSAINNGTVIDHIRSGYALLVLHLFQLLNDKNKITVGLNLPSKRLGFKDIIKIENKVLTAAEASDIAIFAPEATINIVKDFEVIEKMVTHLPEKIENIFLCPNLNCITQAESSESLFHLQGQGKKVQLTCHYCEKAFDRDQVKISTRSKIHYF